MTSAVIQGCATEGVRQGVSRLESDRRDVDFDSEPRPDMRGDLHDSTHRAGERNVAGPWNMRQLLVS